MVLLLFCLLRPGSVEVNYRVEAGSASFQQLEHSSRFVTQYLDEPYYSIVPTSFTAEITSKCKALSVFPYSIHLMLLII